MVEGGGGEGKTKHEKVSSKYTYAVFLWHIFYLFART